MLTPAKVRELAAQAERPQAFKLFLVQIRAAAGPGWAREALEGFAKDKRLDKKTVRACEEAIRQHFGE